MSELYIGVMSGTSLDGIDITLCEIDNTRCQLLESHEYPFDEELKKEILNMIESTTTLNQVGTLNIKLGHLFADSINLFLKDKNIDSNTITAIGLHGQTLWHSVDSSYPFSMQLGCASVVCAKTDIQVVSDFRSMDIANGGEGAPFVPVFHQEIFKHLDKKTAVVNIGGMANISLLRDELRGWDTGVGNVLMDYWCYSSTGKPYDKDAKFALMGEVNSELLDSMLGDDYFKKNPPKSTGREYFNPTWLSNYLPVFQTIKDEDIQRTLLELSAKTITDDLASTDTELVILCGGGTKNPLLVQRIQELTNAEAKISDEFGVSSEYMESIAFAWLAYKRVHKEVVDLSSVTGANKNSILGCIYG